MNLNLITIGDSHTPDETSIHRLTTIKDYVNKFHSLHPLDLVVIEGDIVDAPTSLNFENAKKIVNQIIPRHFVVIGNHDIKGDGPGGSKLFESFFGPSKHVTNINCFQLIFIGLYCEGGCLSGGHLFWDFDFNSLTLAQKMLPTIIFIHGPVELAPPNTCTWGQYFGYAMHNPYDIKKELGKFSDIKAIYAGHAHFATKQTFTIGNSKNVHQITNGALITRSVGCSYDSAGIATNFIGHSTITDTSFTYELLDYTKPVL